MSRFLVRGKRDKFEILEIRPTKHFTAKLKQNYHFFGKETFGVVTSVIGEKPGERSVQFDVYEVKQDGYIVLKTNKGGCMKILSDIHVTFVLLWIDVHVM